LVSTTATLTWSATSSNAARAYEKRSSALSMRLWFC
jgi:hypothetical protein